MGYQVGDNRNLGKKNKGRKLPNRTYTETLKLGQQPRGSDGKLVFRNAAGGWKIGKIKTYDPNDKSTYIASAKDNTSYNKPKQTIGTLSTPYLETNYIAKAPKKSYRRKIKDDVGTMVPDKGDHDRRQFGKLNLEPDPFIPAFTEQMKDYGQKSFVANKGSLIPENVKRKYINTIKARSAKKAYLEAHKDGKFAITTQNAKLGTPSFVVKNGVVQNSDIVKQQITKAINKNKNKDTMAELSTTGAGILGNVKGHDRALQSLLYMNNSNQSFSGEFNPNKAGETLSILEKNRLRARGKGKVYETEATRRYKKAHKSGVHKLTMLQKARQYGA